MYVLSTYVQTLYNPLVYVLPPHVFFHHVLDLGILSWFVPCYVLRQFVCRLYVLLQCIRP